MATAPAYAANPRLVDVVQATTANTNRDGTGTIATLCSGVTAGTRVTAIVAKATGTTTAGSLRFYISVDSGTTWRLIDEMRVTALTPSATAPTFSGRIEFYPPLVLFGTAARIGVSTHNSETFNVFARAVDF